MADLQEPEPRPMGELLSLEGKVAIVTGGSRGIGRRIVERFCEAGAKVVLTGRNPKALEAVEAELRGRGHDVSGLAADVSKVADAPRTVAFAVERYGRLDILVNNAASFPFCDTLSMTEQVWDSCFDTDAKGTFFMAQAAAREMISEGRGGRIVNFMSTAALNPTDPLVAYGAAKQAVWYVTRTMAQALAPHRITVNAATPGATMTAERLAAFSGDASQAGSFIESSGNAGLGAASNVMALAASDPSAIAGLLEQAMPMGRPGFPDDLAKAVLFLASDMGAYVTGQNITVDGAQSIQNPMGAMMRQIQGGGAEDADGPRDDAGEEGSVRAGTGPDAGAPMAAGPAGTWVSTLDTPLGKNDLAIELACEDGGLSGTVALAGVTSKIEDGHVDGAEVRFVFRMRGPVGKVRVQVSAALVADELRGKIKLPVGNMAIDFVAHRS